MFKGLFEALKKLTIENNYETAKTLYNSVSSDLWSCKPLLQADPYLMLITIIAMMTIFALVSGLLPRTSTTNSR
jgi:hypothetical protein